MPGSVFISKMRVVEIRAITSLFGCDIVKGLGHPTHCRKTNGPAGNPCEVIWCMVVKEATEELPVKGCRHADPLLDDVFGLEDFEPLKEFWDNLLRRLCMSTYIAEYGGPGFTVPKLSSSVLVNVFPCLWF